MSAPAGLRSAYEGHWFIGVQTGSLLKPIIDVCLFVFPNFLRRVTFYLLLLSLLSTLFTITVVKWPNEGKDALFVLRVKMILLSNTSAIVF